MGTWKPVSSVDRKQLASLRPRRLGASRPRQQRWQHQTQTCREQGGIDMLSQNNKTSVAKLIVVKDRMHSQDLVFILKATQKSDFNGNIFTQTHNWYMHFILFTFSLSLSVLLTWCWVQCKDYKKPGSHCARTRSKLQLRRGLREKRINNRDQPVSQHIMKTWEAFILSKGTRQFDWPWLSQLISGSHLSPSDL